MIDVLLTYASGLLLLLGVFFMLTGAVGLLRFPDFYSRMHAAGITDTLAAFLVLSGLMLAAGWSIALFKLALIMLFIFFTSPTASHALARSAQFSAMRLPCTSTGSAAAGAAPSAAAKNTQTTEVMEATNGSTPEMQ